MAFVSDRTFLDDAVYAELSSGDNVRSRAILATSEGYDVVFHMHSDRFQDLGDDPARNRDPSYQEEFEAILCKILKRVACQKSGAEVIKLTDPTAEGVVEEAIYHLERLEYIDDKGAA